MLRALLNRQSQQLLLPVGLDGMSLDSSVTLLDYNQQGKYLVGAVRFESVSLEPTLLNAVWRQQGQLATMEVFQLTSLNPSLPTDKLIETLVHPFNRKNEFTIVALSIYCYLLCCSCRLLCARDKYRG
jgi:hypothetical protein